MAFLDQFAGARLDAEAAAFLILFARVGAVLMLLPVFSDEGVPARIRLLIALAMSAGLWGLLSVRTLPAATAAMGTAGAAIGAGEVGAGLPGILVAELLTGLGLGMVARIMFQAIAVAGSIISLQIGITSAIVPDAAQGGSAMLLSRFLSVAATVVCMALSVHHLWIAAIVRSYAVFPVGGLPGSGDFARLALDAATRSMALGCSLAAPLIVYGIVFNIALGLSARLAPAVQVFFVAQPLNLLLGAALLAVTLGAILVGFADSEAGWLAGGWN